MGKTCTSNVGSYLSLIHTASLSTGTNVIPWTPATLLSFRILLHVGKLKDTVIGMKYNV